MKKLICEMCGSAELIKQDGVFICQHCGCKYSVEEAKKMYVEGKVDVSGSTVTVDNLPKIEAMLKRAKEFETGNAPDIKGYTERYQENKAIEYYNKVLDIDPQNAVALKSIKHIKEKQDRDGKIGCLIGAIPVIILILIVLFS